MRYRKILHQVDWKDECSWMLISAVSGVVLSIFFLIFDRFPNVKFVSVLIACCIGFYGISIFLRIQNRRSKPSTGKAETNARRIKVGFPIVGFILGFAWLLI
jgi:hypothetical protein